MFPLIKLAKKLKGFSGRVKPRLDKTGTTRFPLIKLAKKLKD